MRAKYEIQVGSCVSVDRVMRKTVDDLGVIHVSPSSRPHEVPFVVVNTTHVVNAKQVAEALRIAERCKCGECLSCTIAAALDVYVAKKEAV